VVDGTGSGLYHTTATSGSDTVLIDLRRLKEEDVALGWMVLSYLWR